MKRTMPLLLVGVVMLVACSTPTPAPPTPTPTETLVEEDREASPVPAGLPTLPPTWTPLVQPSETRPPTASPAPFTPGPTQTAHPDCALFRSDLARMEETFVLGTSPTLYWIPIASATAYRIYIYDPGGELILIDFGEEGEDQYVVPADLFEADPLELELNPGTIVYGWEVTPFGPDGEQICMQTGGELIPVLGTTATPTQEAIEESGGEG